MVEFIPDEDRVTPPIPASFTFMMVATTQHGDAFTEAEYAAMPLPPSQERLIELPA